MYKNIYKILSSSFVSLFTQSIKISFIVGSKLAFFSFSSILSPAIGALNKTSSLFIIFAIQIIFSTINNPEIALLNLFLYKLPGIAGALYASSNNKLKVFIPALFIILFILHPVGNIAWLYSMYWLIPIALINNNNIFCRFLSASFLTHGMGSIIYLYTKNLAPEIWISLIPIVLLERLIIASGSTLIYSAINNIKNYYISHISGNNKLYGIWN